MGSLRRFSLQQIKDQFNLDVFFETGIGWAHGVQYAQTANFKKIYSVDIVKEIVDRFTPQFLNDPRVKLVHSSSAEALNKYCDEIQENILFYLDAHFPGADLGLAQFDSEKNEKLRLPLFSELEIIREKRAKKGVKDLILLDDLMIYDDENHYPGDDVKAKFSIAPREDKNRWKEILEFFSETHISKKYDVESGFVAFIPKP